MQKLDLKIQIKLENLDQLEDVINRVSKALEKECNCTCTLDVIIQ